MTCFSGSFPLSSRSGTQLSFSHVPHSCVKPVSQRWLYITQDQPPGRNPRRKSLTSGEPFLIRNMAPRSPREQGLQTFPAQTPGRPRGPAICSCVLGAIGPPTPAALVSRLLPLQHCSSLQLWKFPQGWNCHFKSYHPSSDFCSSLSNVGRRKGMSALTSTHETPPSRQPS